MEKKAGIWISAILYFALGVVILTIVLATTLPIIEQLKNKNVIVQTKNLMSDLDENIRAVYSEGPGSQRTVEITINRGDFIIEDNSISFNLESKFQESETDIPIQSGYLTILTTATSQEDIFNVELKLNYSAIIILESDISQISGSKTLITKNKGGDDKPTIEITEI
tara:strand:- start:171 stop:671 length:501 start_codon:yes stop_codon:yes gene_type:complete